MRYYLTTGLATLMIGGATLSVAHAEPSAAAGAGAAWVADRVQENIKATDREKTVVDKVVKGTTGISLTDIKKHGLKGGPNSVINKPFGNLFK